ncbi:helix-turn-helix transcriptional regulator [Acetobacter malorum]|uniref:helix-turn-helix transcriptional regulator n=1 Tax=Acetobacter malorum TaxID=178901 RepID=UPI00248E3E27|nr:helix-turn-helix transcriptional regulator [Acetobacter malorum]
MIRPDDLWEALDALALEQGLTPSGLARAAGLDPTTFNPSRRISPHGDMRWMALPTLLRALDVLKISLADFIRRLEGTGRGQGAPTARRIRGLPLSRLRGSGLFDSTGHPTGVLWDEVTLPCAVTGDAYAIRVDTDAMEPLLREGSSLVLMPDMPPRRSDRVLLWRSGMEPVLGILVENAFSQDNRVCAAPASVPLQTDKGETPSGSGGGIRWAVLPYQRSEQGGGVHALGDATDSAVLVPEGKAGVWLHRIVMGTF